MESNEIRDALRGADRAEAAPWTDYPPTPRWYPPATGIWAGLFVLAFAGLDGSERTLVLLGLIAAEFGFVRWYVHYRQGVMPTGRPPREFRGAIAGFVAAAVVIVLGSAALAAWVSPWAAAGYAAVLTTAVIVWYEKAYAAAAQRARERLA